MVESNTTWSTNWDDLISHRLKEAGYGSIGQLLAEMPSRPYSEVAQRLDDSIAPIQILRTQYKEAKAAGEMRTAAMDSLCRNIVEEFPGGWGIGDNPDWQLISALSGWSSEIIVTGESAELEPVLDRVMNEIRRLQPTTGWLPKGPDDAIIQKVFDEGWPS